MKKLKFLSFLLLFLPTVLFSQDQPKSESFIKNKFGIKLNYGFYDWSKIDGSKLKFKDKMHNVQLEVNYGFTKWLDAGVFVNFYPTKGIKFTDTPKITMHDNELVGIEGDTERFYYSSFAYGFAANVHILPLFVNPNFSLVDVYVTPKIGLHTLHGKDLEYIKYEDYLIPVQSDGVNYTRTGFYCSIGAGVALNVSKNFGFLVEYNFMHEGKSLGGANKHYARYGINIRF